MKNLLIAALFGSSALMSGAALAQQPADPAAPPAEGETMQQPADGAAEPMAPTGEAADAPMAGEGALDLQNGFLAAQGQDQMIGSDLMGANVMGIDNESIGSVDDLVLDRDGRIVAVVVGVGGFLGIGQKDVAIPTDSLEFVLAQDAAPADGTMADPAAPADPAMAPADPAAPAATDPATPADPAPATTGEAPAGTTPTGTATGTWGWTGGNIDHIRVDFTRDQLEAAPEFTSID